MTLANFTASARIFPHLKGAAAGSVLFELSRALQSQLRVPDWPGLDDAVLRKPSLASVNAKAEIAFPHARLDGVKIVSFAFGRCDKTIPWGADGSARVRIISPSPPGRTIRRTIWPCFLD
jgi:mannitol/fructose-specific phosphotransferase system IIA component (Ntr-type)